MRAGVFVRVAIICITAMLLGNESRARAEFMFISQSAVFNPASQEVQFTIEFNQAPDFFTVDAFGRPENSFQYFIVGNPKLPYPQNYDSIIRGDEIHVTMDTIRVRNSFPPNYADPNSGGWGSIRGSVPFILNDNILTFSTPLDLISNHSIDGNFNFRLDTYVFGSTTESVISQSIVAEPSSLMLIGIGTLTLIGYAGWRKQAAKKSHVFFTAS